MKGSCMHFYLSAVIIVVVAIGILAVVLAAGGARAETGLVAKWSFDEGTGTTAVDSSGNNNNGTINGATWVDGVSGKALRFDGVNDYVEIPQSSTLNVGGASGSYSIGFWMKANATPSGVRWIITKYPNGQYIQPYPISISIDSSGKVTTAVFDSQDSNYSTGTTVVTDGNWHYVVSIVDRSTNNIRIGIDGNIQNTISISNIGDMRNSAPIALGWDEGQTGANPDVYFNGIIDEVKIYNSTLSASEISQSYNTTWQNYLNSHSLVANWHFDDENVGVESVTTLSTKLPNGRLDTSAIWDGSNAYIFGGGDANGYLDQIVKFNPSTGTVTTLSAKLPSARGYTSAIWDGSNAYIFGGDNDNGVLDQIVKFTPSTGMVTTLSAKLPSARTLTSAIWDGSNAYIFGGIVQSTELDQIVKFTPSTGTVTTLSSKLPSGRYAMSAIWDGSNVYLFGGYNGTTNELNQIVKFTPNNGTVTTLSTVLPYARISDSAIWDGTNICIFGGYGGSTVYDQIVKFNPGTVTVSLLSAKLPSGRYRNSAIWDDTNAYIFGGYDGGSTCFDQIVKFNPGAIVVDSSGNGNNGTIYGAARVDGMSGKSLRFDGVNDYVFVPDAASLKPTSITIECWVKPNINYTSATPLTALIVKNTANSNTIAKGYILYYMTGGLAFSTAYSSTWYGVSKSIILEKDKWYHISGTYDGATVKLYVNGSMANSVSNSYTVTYDNSPVWIGKAYTNSGYRYFNGIIDEVRIYNRALTASEIKADYDSFTAVTVLDEGFENGLGNWSIQVWGGVPYGVTTSNKHSGSYSMYVGPSTCGASAFDNYRVEMTKNFATPLPNATYQFSYWRREPCDWGAQILFYINGNSVQTYYDPGPTSNGWTDSGWYMRSFNYTGGITSIMIKETDLTTAETVYFDDLMIIRQFPQWPMFHHDNKHTGLSEYDTANVTGITKWKFNTGDLNGDSPVIGSDGTIYLAPESSSDRALYAINPDGTQKWKYVAGNNTGKSPAIASDGTIYFGCDDNKLYAIRPDGTLKWTFTGSYPLMSPSIGQDGTIYVSSYYPGNKLYAINPDGTQKWTYTLDWTYSSPAIGDDGTIYIGTAGNKLYAIKSDGTIKWTFTANNWIITKPAIGADGTVYAGSKDGNLYAIYPANGTKKWQFTTGGEVWSSPAVDKDGTIYFGSNDDKLYAINPDGTQKWNYATQGDVGSSPVLGKEGTIYFGSMDNKIYALYPNGLLKWSYTTSYFYSSSAAIDKYGNVYIGAYDGYLYCFGNLNYPVTPTITTTPYTDSDGSYSINWTLSTNAAKYILAENGATIYNGTGVAYSFNNKVDGTYVYTVWSWNSNGTSYWSTSVAVIVNNAKLPGIPSITTIACTDTDGSYNINWTTSTYAVSYILEENSVQIYNGTNMAYSFTGKPDGTYVYRTRAWNSNGTSSLSSSVAIVVDVAKLPGAPSITTVSYTDTDGAYNINWTTAAYVTKYVLEENDIEVYNGTSFTRSFSGKADGTYTYRVKSWNSNGTSSWSSPVSIAVDNAKLPSAPAITTISYTDFDGIYDVNWTSSQYAQGYILKENVIELYNGTALTYPFNGKPGGNYSYTVKAWNTNGTSTESNIVTIVVEKLNNPPTAFITTPQEGQSFVEGTTINFTGYGFDVEDSFLTAARISWSSNVSGSIGTGNKSVNDLPAGSHRTTLTVRDSGNSMATNTTNITITRGVARNNNTATWYVDLQSAIDSASPGDTIYVRNGTYNEITISKQINLIGESQQNVIIKGVGAADSKGVYVTASNVNVNNVKIDNFFYGIYLESSSSDSITAVTITNCSSAGFYSISGTNNTITNSVLSNNAGVYDIRLASSSSATTTNTSFNASRVSCDGDSLLCVKNYLGVVIRSLDLTPLLFADVEIKDDAIVVFSGQTAADGTVSNILIADRTYNNNITTENATIIRVSYDNLIFANNNRNVDMSMARTEYFQLVAVKNNNTGNFYSKIQDAIDASSAGDTVYVYNGTYYEQLTINKQITLAGENCYGTVLKGDGASLSKGIYITTSGVKIYTLKIDGFYYGVCFYWQSSNNNTVASNILQNNSHSGIYSYYGSNNIITSNTIQNNTVSGIYLEYSSYNLVTYNTIMDNDQYGLYLSHSQENNVTGTTISNNNDFDICVASSSSLISLNSTFNEDKLLCDSTSQFTVKNSISVTVRYPGLTPIENATVKVYDNGVLAYSIQTDAGGQVGPITATDRVYNGSTTYTDNVTMLNVSYGPLLFVNNGRSTEMRTSHTEYFEPTIAAKNNNTGNFYSKIQDAINASSAGDTVYVYNGTYYEQLTINKQITLAGEDAQNTRVRGTGASGSKGIYIVSCNATIKSINIDKFQYDIYASSSVNTTVSDVIISNSTNYDAYLVSTSSVTSINTRFSADKVYVDTSSAFVVKNYITIAVNDSDMLPFQYVNATIEDNDIIAFSGQINLSSEANNILVTDRIYNMNSTASENTTIVTISYTGLIFHLNNRSVDMSSSHTEYFDVDVPPVSHIIIPAENNIFIQGDSVILSGYSNDQEDHFDSTLAWYSDSIGYTGNNNHSLNTTGWTTGVHTIFLNATDKDGSASTATVNITIMPDNSPMASITTLDGQVVSNNTVMVLGAALDDRGINRIEVRMNSGSWSYATGTNSWSKVQTLTEGANTIEARAVDTYNQYSTVQQIVVNYVPPNNPAIPNIITCPYTSVNGSYSINWTSTAYATKYILEENGIEIYNEAVLTYSFDGKPDGIYAYRVKAWNVNGTSNWSSSVVIIVDNAKLPETPPITTIEYTDTDGIYNINWTSSKYAAKYILEENGVEIYNGTDLTYPFTGKADGSYSYRLKAWNANGTSNWSSPVAILIDLAKLPGVPVITTAAYTDTSGSYTINWSSSSYATRYVLEENGIEIYNDTALTCSLAGRLDGSYVYRIRAWNTNGTSNWGTTLAIVVDNAKLPGMPAITTVTHTNIDGSYSVNWTPSVYAAKYILEENGVEIYNGTDLTYPFTGKADGSYSYRLKAWNANGTSNCSSDIVTIVVAMPDLIITDVSITPTALTHEDTATINAAIRNIGAAPASSVNVTFHIDNVVYSIINIINVSQNSSTIASTQWTAITGAHIIFVSIENTTPAESNIQNNRVNISIIVSAPPQATVGHIYGKVTDSSSNPIKNAVVAIGSKQVKTNQSGEYSLRNVIAGARIIIVSKLGHKTVELDRDITEGLQMINIVLPVINEDDITPPAIAISGITNNTIVMNKTVNISGTAIDIFGIKKIQITADKVTWLPVNGISNWYAFVALQDGPNTIYVKASDTSNNTNTTSIRIILQEIIPSVDTGGIGRELSQGVPFKFRANGSEHTIVIMALRDNGTDIGVEGVSVPYTTGETKKYDTNRNGQNDLSITLVSANKIAGTVIVSIKSLEEDFEKPSVSIISHKDKDKVKTAKIKLEGTATDNKGIAKIEVSMDNKTWTLANGTTSWKVDISLAEGKNTIYVNATDLFGNTEMSILELTYEKEKAKSRGFIPATDASIILATLGLLTVASALFRRRKSAF
ncbi:MAG: PQQ-binding-like beta-propeller repeat protein [Thermoplasmata archaeon]